MRNARVCVRVRVCYRRHASYDELVSQLAHTHVLGVILDLVYGSLQQTLCGPTKMHSCSGYNQQRSSDMHDLSCCQHLIVLQGQEPCAGSVVRVCHAKSLRGVVVLVHARAHIWCWNGEDSHEATMAAGCLENVRWYRLPRH